MSSTGGGGGGAGFFAGAAGFFFGARAGGFELLAAGFFVAVGFAGAGSAANDEFVAHTAAIAAATMRARASEASMGGILRGPVVGLTSFELEAGLHGQPQRARLHRVEMAVLDWLRFARELAFIEICDVVVVRIEEVVDRKCHGETPPETPAYFGIDHRRRIRPDTVVFDERRRPEMAEARSAEPAAGMLYGGANRRDVFHRAGNVIASGVRLAEAPMGPG